MGIITKFLNKCPLLSYIMLALVAMVDALVSIILIYPNDFAPVGIQGFTAMIQHIFGVSVGYTYILVNAPMLIIAFFVLNKAYSFKNLSYIITFSVMTVAFQQIILHLDLGFLEYHATTSEQSLVAAVGYGIFFGIAYPVTIWLGGSTGGTDILAALINHFKPTFNMVWVLFSMNAGVAVMSYFVYGRNAFPVILSVLCSFVSGYISDYMLKGAASALKFEIVTDRPDELADEIMERLDRGCTQLPSKGMYSGAKSSMLVCIVSKKQRVDMERIISEHEGSFGFCSPVKSTYGYFERHR